MKTQTIRTTLGLATAAVTATVLASPASADTMTRDSLSWPASDEVVATCEGGVEIGLGFDLTRNVHDQYDAPVSSPVRSATSTTPESSRTSPPARSTPS